MERTNPPTVFRCSQCQAPVHNDSCAHTMETHTGGLVVIRTCNACIALLARFEEDKPTLLAPHIAERYTLEEQFDDLEIRKFHIRKGLAAFNREALGARRSLANNTTYDVNRASNILSLVMLGLTHLGMLEVTVQRDASKARRDQNGTQEHDNG